MKHKNNYICVVGGANVDISGTPLVSLKNSDSSPGNISTSFGGVGRNIAENLSGLGAEVELISAFGNNFEDLKQDCRLKKIGIEHSVFSEKFSTSTYLCLNDQNGEMKFAISDMNICNLITEKFILSKIDLINNSQACIIDTNVPEKTIQCIVRNCKTKIFVDPVSVTKTGKLKNCLKNVFAIKPNILEAQVLSGQKISRTEDIQTAAEKILNLGVKNVFISMGSKGLYYSNLIDSGFIPCVKKKIINTTGAGDSLMAGIVWANLKGLPVEIVAKTGVLCSSICVQSEKTVSENLNEQTLKKLLKSE